MKKFELFGIIVTIFSLLFIGCQNIADTSSCLNDTTIKRRAVTITVTSSENSLLNNFEETSTSRTITPVAVQSNELNYYICGKDLLLNKNLPVQKVNYIKDLADPNSGTISFDVNSGTYYSIILIAVNKATDDIELSSSTTIQSLQSKAMFYADAIIDFVNYDTPPQLLFTLNPTGLNQKGKFNFKLYLKDWCAKSLASHRGDAVIQTIFKVDAGIYKNGILQGDSTIPISFTDKQSLATAYSYLGELDAGNYEIILKFNKDNNIYIYSEDFVILPGQDTIHTFAIPDLLMNSPDTPSDFKQGYILPSDTNKDFYYVLFNWTDNSNTEDYFEIEIQDECTNTSNVTPTTVLNDTVWNSQVGSYTTSYTTKDTANTTNFIKSSSWYAGSLNKNSTWAAFYMPLGKRYIARIRAVNDAGSSDWVYATSAITTATIPGGSSTAEESNLLYSKNLTAAAFNSSVINMYRIKYNLVGGSFTTSVPNTYYFDQTTAGTSIMIPDGVTTNSLYNSGNVISLKKTADYTWLKWKIGNLYGSDFDTSNNYEGFENLDLYATYEAIPVQVAPVDYTIASNLSFSLSSTGTGVQPSLSISSDSITLKKVDVENSYSISTLNINYSYLSTPRYYTVKAILKDNNNDEIGTFTESGNSLAIPISSTGTYTVTIKAYPDSTMTTSYDYSITLIVQ